MANNVDPDQTPLSEASVLVYTVCSGLSVRLLRVYESRTMQHLVGSFSDSKGPDPCISA